MPKVVSSGLVAFALPVVAGPAPVDLRCEGMCNPLAAPAAPRLSWRIESESRGEAQSAWQILVASSAGDLEEGRGDLWDSGKVVAGRLPWVAYEGAMPAPGQRCHWEVRSWDHGDVPSSWSNPAVWDVAPLTSADWHGARWIDDGRENPTRDEDFYRPDPAPLMRHEFTLAKPVTRARLHLAGLGLTLGNGWCNPLPLRMWGHRNIRGNLPTGRPRAIATIEIPSRERKRLSEGGRPIDEAPGVERLPPAPGVHRLRLDSEHDQFALTPAWRT